MTPTPTPGQIDGELIRLIEVGLIVGSIDSATDEIVYYMTALGYATAIERDLGTEETRP